AHRVGLEDGGILPGGAEPAGEQRHWIRARRCGGECIAGVLDADAAQVVVVHTQDVPNADGLHPSVRTARVRLRTAGRRCMLAGAPRGQAPARRNRRKVQLIMRRASALVMLLLASALLLAA